MPFLPPRPYVKYRICTKCIIHHYENCSHCFGWGFRENGILLIANDIIDLTEKGFIPRPFAGGVVCRQCGSDCNGYYKGDLA